MIFSHRVEKKSSEIISVPGRLSQKKVLYLINSSWNAWRPDTATVTAAVEFSVYAWSWIRQCSKLGHFFGGSKFNFEKSSSYFTSKLHRAIWPNMLIIYSYWPITNIRYRFPYSISYSKFYDFMIFNTFFEFFSILVFILQINNQMIRHRCECGQKKKVKLDIKAPLK